MNKTALVVLAAVLGALVSAVALMFFRPNAADQVSNSSATAAPTSPAVGGAPVIEASAIPAAKSLGPLPPLNQPLRESLNGLRSRADQGDSGAACRLAAEYAYCQELKTVRFTHARWLADRELAFQLMQDPAAREEATRTVGKEMSFRDERLARYEDHCAEVAPPSVAQSVELWRRAAALGSVSAMRQYASGNAFRWENILDSMPQLQVYRKEAEGIALRAASEGELEMMMQLASAYSPVPNARKSLLAQSVKSNPAYSLAIFRHMQTLLAATDTADTRRMKRVVDSRVNELEATLEPKMRAESDAILRDQVSKWKAPDVNRADVSAIQPDNPSQISLESCGAT